MSTPVARLGTLGLTYDQAGEALGKAGGKPAPSRQRVYDWAAGRRPVPKWAEEAALDVIIDSWVKERAVCADAAVREVDARFAGLIDPVLGAWLAFYDDQKPAMRDALGLFHAQMLEMFRDRLGRTLPRAI